MPLPRLARSPIDKAKDTAQHRRNRKVKIFKRDKGKCFYCRRQLKISEATLDHIYPLSKGGADSNANVVIACKMCNEEKGTDDPGCYLRKVHGKRLYKVLLKRRVKGDWKTIWDVAVERRAGF